MRAHTQFTRRGVEALLGVILVLTLLAAASSAFAQQDAEQLIQSGLYQEEVKGDLEKAIKVYEGILKDFPKNRPIAATALLHIGLCYEKRGETVARKHYQRLVNEYGDQPTLVAQARVRLANLGYGTNGETLAMSTRQVWAPALDNMGAPSPDGRYISYVNWDKGNMAVHDIQTGENRDLTDEGTWGAPVQFGDTSVWSPDSNRIAYLWLSRGDKAKDNWGELRIVGLDGSKPRSLYRSKTEGTDPWPTAWSQDGKYILAVLGKTDESQKRGHEDRIALISVADGSVRVLKSLGTRHTQIMSLSPDGRYVAFELSSKEGPNERNICLLATDGSGNAAVVEIEHPADDWAPYWAPSGKQVVFTSDRSGSDALWILEVDEGEAKGAPKLVNRLDEKFSPMGFTQDGSFYYSLENSSRNVYVASVDFETGKILSPPAKVALRFEGSNYAPNWSPDGKYLAYASRRMGAHDGDHLVIRSLETGEERDLKPESLRMRGGPQWSPDGRSILVYGEVKGERGYHLVDVQTGDFTTIMQFPPGQGKANPDFSKDGKQIFYFRNQSIMALNLETHEEKELYRSNTRIVRHFNPSPDTRCSTSPDGRQLVFVESETLASEKPMVVRTLSTSGGEPNDLYSLGNSSFDGVSWTPDGDSLVIKRRGKLFIIPAEGGDAREINLGFKMDQVSLHPDGQRIAFTRGARGRDIWALENFLPDSTAGE